MPTDWPSWPSPARSTGLGRSRTDKPDFGFFRRTSAELCAAILQPNEHNAAVLRQYLARIDDGRLKRAFAAAIETGEPKTSSGGKPFKRDNGLWKGLSSRANQPLQGLRRTLRDCRAGNSGAVGGRAIERVLFAPFRPGTAHIMVVRPVFPARPIPGRAEKRQHGAGDLAQQRNNSGGGERKFAACDAPREEMNAKRRAGWPAVSSSSDR